MIRQHQQRSLLTAFLFIGVAIACIVPALCDPDTSSITTNNAAISDGDGDYAANAHRVFIITPTAGRRARILLQSLGLNDAGDQITVSGSSVTSLRTIAGPLSSPPAAVVGGIDEVLTFTFTADDSGSASGFQGVVNFGCDAGEEFVSGGAGGACQACATYYVSTDFTSNGEACTQCLGETYALATNKTACKNATACVLGVSFQKAPNTWTSDRRCIPTILPCSSEEALIVLFVLGLCVCVCVCVCVFAFSLSSFLLNFPPFGFPSNRHQLRVHRTHAAARPPL